MANKPLYLVDLQLYRVPSFGVAVVPLQVMMHINASVQYRWLWCKVCLGTDMLVMDG